MAEISLVGAIRGEPEPEIDLAGRFAQIARQSLEPHERLVKTIGDAVMVTALTPV